MNYFQRIKRDYTRFKVNEHEGFLYWYLVRHLGFWPKIILTNLLLVFWLWLFTQPQLMVKILVWGFFANLVLWIVEGSHLLWSYGLRVYKNIKASTSNRSSTD